VTGREAFLPRDLAPEQVISCIGLISDTHMPEKCLALPASVHAILSGVDLILHAGDVGELWVLDRLSELAPVVAVHGNDDSAEATRALPYRQVIARVGQRIVLCHGHFLDPDEERAWRRRHRTRGDWVAVCAALAHTAGAQIVVYGHTHVPMVYRHEGVLLINPGAIAPPAPVSRQLIRTVALLYLDRGGAPFVTHVDVDHPTQPFAPDWWQQHDWLAGVRPLTHRFTGSIAEPAFMEDSVRIWERLRGESRELRETYHAALLRLAHRCWSGEIACITRAGLIQQLRGTDDAPAQAHDQLIAWLESGIRDALASEREPSA
jgi:uncharacterized protein